MEKIRHFQAADLDFMCVCSRWWCWESRRLVYDWQNSFLVISENVLEYCKDYIKILQSIPTPL